MRVFDFSEGIKTRELRDAAAPNWFEEGPYKVDDKRYRFASKAFYTDTIKMMPEQFNVDAICFCIGKESPNGPFIWYVVGTHDWVERMVRSGTLVAKDSV